jgi:hypothetical protein
MRIYDRATLAQASWPATPDGDYARRVLEPLIQHGPQHFIDNAYAEMRALMIDGVVLPLVINRPRPPQISAYVCSPTTHYIDYAKREVELELHDRPLLRRLIPPLLDAWKPLLRWSRFERVVYVNNWLLSTNLYPPLHPQQLRTIRDELIRAFPDHTIVFRSVNEQLNATLLHDLQALDFRPVFSRQVYLLDPQSAHYRRRKAFRSDVMLARRTEYRWLDASQIDRAAVPRLRDLYADLYLHKYSWHNPQFNQRFLEAALRDEWLTIFALQRAGRIDGVLGFVERHGVMTPPLIGYDRALSMDLGLYRLISLKFVEEARERGLLLNLSSGAAAFKRHRGSTAAIEHNLVYDQHCSPRMRLPWRLLAALSRAAIIPIMRRFKL